MAEVNATEILAKLPKNIRGVVAESARVNGERVALVETSGSWTYSRTRRDDHGNASLACRIGCARGRPRDDRFGKLPRVRCGAARGRGNGCLGRAGEREAFAAGNRCDSRSLRRTQIDLHDHCVSRGARSRQATRRRDRRNGKAWIDRSRPAERKCCARTARSGFGSACCGDDLHLGHDGIAEGRDAHASKSFVSRRSVGGDSWAYAGRSVVRRAADDARGGIVGRAPRRAC